MPEQLTTPPAAASLDPAASADPWATAETRVIEPVGGLKLPSPRILVANRDLVYFLARRDVAVRYKQTVVGVVWAVLQPALLAVVFSVFLGRVAKVPSGYDVPYPVFAITGLTLWLFITTSLIRVSFSLAESSNLVSKVYFPRIVIPVAAALPPLFDLVIAFVIAVIVMLLYGVVPSPRVVLVPAAIVLGLSISLGAGLWLAALNVRFRDVAMAVPFVIQVGLFVTPILYPASLVPESVQNLYALNPLVGVFDLYRWCLFSSTELSVFPLLVSVITGVVLLVTGAAYFQRAQAEFADYL